MKLTELKNKILTNINIFDQLLRDNFCFENVRVLHANKIDYENVISCDEEFMSIKLHDCSEIEDFIFVTLQKNDESMTEYEFMGTKIYMSQYINEMD